MPRIHKSIDIDAPREQVFALAADVTKQPQWTTFVRETQIISGDGKSEGSADRSVIKIGPRARTVEHIWTEYRPGEVFARRTTTGMDLRERITFAPADGGTRVEWTVEYTAPMGLLGAFLDVAFMNRVYQNEIEASLENLKARLEG